jgi:DNA-directed RNA polymerase subunit RPC12/RpoP
MRVQFTCADCGSGIEVLANANANKIRCDICGNEQSVTFDSVHEVGDLENCPCCQRKDFYKQKDFNRKIGVIL